MKNKYLFYWHALFLALTSNFIDLNIVVPAVFITAGGSYFQLGILSAITIGGQRFTQLLFGSWLTGKILKKKFLLIGINLRIMALGFLGGILLFSIHIPDTMIIIAIFFLMTIFSFSGAFANIPYTDILGKSLKPDDRKKFMVKRQTIRSVGILISALLVRQFLILFKFPTNYSILFILAAMMLLIGSFAFWKLEEAPSKLINNPKNMVQTLKALPHVLRNDNNLLNYLILSNIMGLSLAVIPFYIALAKNKIGLSAKQVGTFLLVQIIGMIFSNFLWQQLSKRRGYKSIIYTAITINTIPPLGALFFSTYAMVYPFIFFISGFSRTAYEIIYGGVLLEITNDENRPFYTGLSGAGSLLMLIYPLISGILVSDGDFKLLMALTAFFSLMSFIPGIKLDCVKKDIK